MKKLTTQGYEKLSAELNNLLKVERPKVVQGVADAAAEGDRSENAEYIYGKKKLREIDKRLKYLSGLLKDVKIVNPSVIKSDKILFGATVEIADEENKKIKYKIVGEGEADLRDGSISYLSPVAKALLGKQAGDIVEIHRPKGQIEVEIIGVEYV